MAQQTSSPSGSPAGAPADPAVSQVSLDRPRSFSNPRDVALVSASESTWCQGLVRCLRTAGRSGVRGRGGVGFPAADGRWSEDVARDRVAVAAVHAPNAQVRGVLATPTRTGGAELLVGVSVDPTFGAVLVVGPGGVRVEAMRDAGLRVLPVDTGELRRMLEELRGHAVLAGGRGGVLVEPRPRRRGRRSGRVVRGGAGRSMGTTRGQPTVDGRRSGRGARRAGQHHRQPGKGLAKWNSTWDRSSRSSALASATGSRTTHPTG